MIANTRIRWPKVCAGGRLVVRTSAVLNALLQEILEAHPRGSSWRPWVKVVEERNRAVNVLR